MRRQRVTYASVAAVCAVLLLGIWLAHEEPGRESLEAPVSSPAPTFVNGTLLGEPGQPATGTTNVTLEPGIHEVVATASWHRAGQAIRLELVLPNGTVIPGLGPGSYQFPIARTHTEGVPSIQAQLASEAREAFQLKIEYRTGTHP